MLMKTTIYSLSFLLMFMLCAPLQAAKQNDHAQRISKQQAMEIAQQKHPGRVLGVKLKGQNYRVRILNSNGEVRTIIVNAQNGKMARRK